MKKSNVRGRGKGRGVSPDGSRRGRGGAPKKTHSIPPILSSQKSTLKKNPQEQEQLVQWFTQVSISGLSSTSPSLSGPMSSARYKEPVGTKVTQPAATPCTQRPNTESEQLFHTTMGYLQKIYPVTPPPSGICVRSMAQPQNAPITERQSEEEEFMVTRRFMFNG